MRDPEVARMCLLMSVLHTNAGGDRKRQASQGERAGAVVVVVGGSGHLNSLSNPPSVVPRSPSARRTTPTTEGLEQASRSVTFLLSKKSPAGRELISV